MKTLKDFSVADKRVLVRCDFNVPLDDKGNILNDFRIKQTLPTIKYLVDARAKIVLMSHLGKPDGKVVPELKMDKVVERLSEYLNLVIGKEDDCVGPDIEGEVNNLKPGEILMLENLRFHKEEVENDQEFGKKLSYLGDIYVNDAFSVCHRDNASVTVVPQFLPSCAGLLLEKEVTSLNKIIKGTGEGGVCPAKPMVVLVGGTKVGTKAKFIDHISICADYVLVGGLVAKEINDKKIQLKYPEKIISPVGQLDALDIDDETIRIFTETIMKAKTILWNGPFGKFEDKKYVKGSLAIAKAIIDSNAFSVVGGGETVEFLAKEGILDKFSHVSTGGGAMLDYLSDSQLPGLDALKQ